MTGESHISETVSAGQLRAFIERIERVEEEIRELNADKSEIYKELRGCGFDVKAVRQCVAARKLDSAEREERNAIFDLYWSALTGSPRVHVHEATQSYAEAKGRARELTDTQEQPETDEPCDCSERVKRGEYYHCPKCDAEWLPEEDNSPSPETPQAIADDEAAPPAKSSAPIPSAAGLLPGAVKAPEAGNSSPASGACFNNPRCQHPDTCSHAHDQGSCDDCFFDWAKRPLEEQRRLWAEAMEAAETEAA